MGFFLVKSPLAIAIGAALIQPGQVVELDDEEGARLVATGTVEEAQMAPEDQAVYDAAKANAGIAPGEPMVSAVEDDGDPAATDGAEPAAAESADETPAPTAAAKPTASTKRTAAPKPTAIKA